MREPSYHRHPVEDMEPEQSEYEQLCDAAVLFHRVLVWCSQARSVVEAGQRLNVMLYVMAPDLIEAATLEKIASVNNHTRQNVDKMVQDFRDTFAGQRSGPMKSEAARKAYKEAQLKR